MSCTVDDCTGKDCKGEHHGFCLHEVDRFKVIDAFVKLRAERDRLRAALEDIALGRCGRAIDTRNRARAALAESEGA